jgi:heme-degrading monooxygenase HmoA
MVFRPEEVPAFLSIWEENKGKISSFPGVNGVELLRDEAEAHIYYTFSRWDGPAHLEAYRKSELFKGVWSRTRVLFGDKPQAYSLVKPDEPLAVAP